jgi:hypothetical protein
MLSLLLTLSAPLNPSWPFGLFLIWTIIAGQVIRERERIGLKPEFKTILLLSMKLTSQLPHGLFSLSPLLQLLGQPSPLLLVSIVEVELTDPMLKGEEEEAVRPPAAMLDVVVKDVAGPPVDLLRD